MTRPFIFASLVACGFLLGFPCQANDTGASKATSQWTAEIERVAEELGQERWKPALKIADRTVKEMVNKAWFHREALRRELAELTFYQAIASANLGQQEDAWWALDVTRNLGRKVGKEELLPYGQAAKVLLEHPPRRLRKPPRGMEVPRSPFTKSYRPFKRSSDELAVVLNNGGAHEAKPAPVTVEVVVDPRGRLIQPVMVDSQAHPVVIYGVLRAIRKIRPYRPAELAGKPVAAFAEIKIAFD